ncbi:hypothetical protein AX15_002900 [Amanita polypyramis BW_CC]|nr:hypothetical protein AX15_002900 [Amanita polypyramis BW_CC]
MSLVRFKRSVTDFIRRCKKTKHVKACKSVDEILLSTMEAPKHIDPKITSKDEADESSYLEALSDAYHEPETLDIHRSLKYGLDSPLQLSAVPLSPPGLDSPQSPAFGMQPIFEPLDTAKDLAIVPRTPLLPSTPVFEDSPNVFASPCTPSLTCSTPVFSSPVSNVTTASFVAPRIMKATDLELIDFLSKGSCGQVYLARDTVSDRRLALKVIKKVDGVWDHPVVKHILAEEKKIMASLEGCDWFVQLEASWHDTKNIYFAMTYYPTDLESELIKYERFPEERARFYMVEIIIALEDLHKRGIVHRDVKMANILIRTDGHIVLADFGLSKDFRRRPTTAERSYQPYWPYRIDDDLYDAPRRSPAELTFVSNDFCGSEMEMAPEVIRRDYYSFGVDFWSAGIALYTMVTGRHPWSDEEDVAKQILEDDIQFYSEDKISEECKDFIWGLLQKDPADRLRIGLDMTSHSFFAGVDWEAMKNRTVSAPRVPDSTKGHFFFEDWGTIEHFEPGYTLDKDEEDLPGFVYVSPNLQQTAYSDSERTSLQQSVSEDFFARLFRYGSGDDVDDEALCNYEFNEVYEDSRPLGSVDMCSPTISMSQSHASMSPSFHLAPSPVDWKILGCNVKTTSEATIQLIDAITEHVGHVLEVESVPERYTEPVASDTPELTTGQSEYTPEATPEPIAERAQPEVKRIIPELLQIGVLRSVQPISQLHLGVYGCLIDSLPEPTAQHSQTVVFHIPEPTDESEGHDPRVAPRSTTEHVKPTTDRAVPKLLQIATFPVAKPTAQLARPASFQPVLEPLAECVEVTFEPEALSTIVYVPPEDQIERETRAIKLCNKVLSWLKKLLPWTSNANDLSHSTLSTNYDDMTFWESIKWKVKKMWIPKLKHKQCLQRKQTILY